MGGRCIEVEKVCNLICISNKEGHGVISKRCDNFFVMCGWGEGAIFLTPTPLSRGTPPKWQPPFQIAEPETPSLQF